VSGSIISADVVTAGYVSDKYIHVAVAVRTSRNVTLRLVE